MMNDNGSKNVNEHYCVNCRYTWTSRKSGFVPKECPNCKSRKWKGVEPTIPTFAVVNPTKPAEPPEPSHAAQSSKYSLHDVTHSDDEEDGTTGEFIPDRYHINEG